MDKKKKKREDREENSVPTRNPQKSPPAIPADEPTVPCTKEAPIKEPNRNPKIRVLNIPGVELNS